MHRRKPPAPPPSSTAPIPLPHPNRQILISRPSPPTLPCPPLPLAATLLLTLRLLSALKTPISDCDETFNYWEPLHYLHFRYGLQTWEYSPIYALRSYAYLLPYTPLISLATHLHAVFPNIASPKILAFYLIRLTLACTSAAAETTLFAATRHRFGNDVAAVLLPLLAFSPGVSRAAVELLPSSFAMIALTAAVALWMCSRFAPAVFLVAMAALLGWIYAAAMAVPLALDILCRRGGFVKFLTYAAMSGVPILAGMALVDSFYYGKLVLAPLNHVLYNVFPKEGTGSHLFGVDSVWFYVKNLFLNCNISAVLLAFFPFLCIIQAFIAVSLRQDASEKWSRLRYLLPSYLWLAILGSQPHKEERFLAPCYTFIALVAAVAFVDGLELVLQITGLTRNAKEHGVLQKSNASSFSNASSITKRIMTSALLLTAVVCGMSRLVMQVKAFQAPLLVYHHLSQLELRNGAGPRKAPDKYANTSREVSICIGKEWYRFPNSFFLPHRRFRVRFVRGGFSGLMPKPFREDNLGTQVIPSGMNEFNKEDPSQYYDWREGQGCHYFIDLDLSHRGSERGTSLVDEFPIPEASRAVVFSHAFLDSEYSRAGFRAFYIPGFESKLVYGQYQLIRNLNLLPYMP